MNISILGAGAWGTAMAMALSARHEVLLWSRFDTEISAMREAGENADFLPGFKLPNNLKLTADLDETVAHVAGENSLLLVAAPVAGLRPLAQRLADKDIPNFVWLCKGFEESTGCLPHQVVAEAMGVRVPCGVLSGPSFAKEVAAGMPCALTIASVSAALCRLTVEAVHSPGIRVYSTDDVIGVEVGGAVKNILAIAAGIADGMALGLNARAALLTRGLAEITRLGVALGGRMETFMGLTGVGDLILTCTGDLSRNRTVGLELAKGKPLATIVTELGHVAEGVPCARAVSRLAEARGIDMPISNAVASVLFEGVRPADMVVQLMARAFKPEVA